MNIIESRMEKRGQGGFTLIELLVVIAILAVLAGAAIIGIGAMRDNAKNQACKTDKDTIETAIEAYKLDDTQSPATAEEPTLAELSSSEYLKRVDTAAFALTYNATHDPQLAHQGKYAGVACA